MCKVFTMTNFSKVKKIKRTVDVISEALASYEKDGIGYSILGKSGVYGERSIDAAGFKYRLDVPELDAAFVDKNYNRFGTQSKASGGAIFHGRTSTNDKTLLNTHPINKHGWSLIHNGVVTDHGPKYKMLTTNDTEHVLENLVRGGIAEVAKNLTGYYAIAAIDSKGNLHVAKDAIARLYCAKVDSLESYIFATTQDLIEEVCAELNWKCSTICPVKDNTYLVFDSEGTLTEHSSFEPRGSTSWESAWSSQSLGFKVGESLQNSSILELKTTSGYVDTDSQDDEAMFLAECAQADASYAFKDYYGADITLEQFQDLDDDDKVYCTVIRSDGTVCSPYDYHTDKLYDGFSYGR